MGATGRDIVEQAEARLAPLLEDANIAWWDSQVEATEDNAAKRERAELAWSNALADREQFAAVESARDQARAATSAGASTSSTTRLCDIRCRTG